MKNPIRRGVVLALGALFALVGCECGEGTVRREARLEFTVSGLQFGVVTVGQKAVKTVGLKNTGSAVAIVERIETAAPFGVAGESSFEVGPGETRELEVSYAPTAPNAAGENHTGEVVVSNDTEAGPLSLSLVGHAIEPVLALNPQTLDFGEVNVGETKNLPVTVENKGTDKFEITAVSVSPPGAFTVDATKLKGTYQPGAKTTVDVTFAPGAGEAASAKLLLETTVAGAAQAEVALKGVGLAPKITLCYALEGAQETCLDASKSAGTLNFGAVDEGTSKKARFTVRNDGNAAVPLVGFFPGGRMGQDLTAAQNPCAASPVIADFVFSPDRFPAKLPEDPTEAEPNPPKSVTMELTYTPRHEPNCRHDNKDNARLSFRAGPTTRSPVFQVDIQGASRIGVLSISNVTYNGLNSPVEIDYSLKNDGAGQLTVSKVEIVSGYSGVLQAYDCKPQCATRVPCTDPSAATRGECEAFSFATGSNVKSNFNVASGATARITDGAKDIRYVPPASPGQAAIACIRITSNDPISPIACANLEGLR
ncbi:MAG: choice-of-anchor D domain-containing protein [Myxococcales bacterium]